MPPPVREAMARQIVSHRSDDFRRIVGRITSRLIAHFECAEKPLLFTASGTGGMEAAIANTIPRGQRILAVQVGAFGERFADIARAHGAHVIDMRISYGRAAEPDELRKAIRRAYPINAVLLTHNETSTGVLNPLAELARVVREESEALVIVDAISSVGAVPLRMEQWGIDVVVTVTQKALMSPPGIAIIGVSKRALDVAAKPFNTSYYFNFIEMRRALADDTTTFTPAVTTLFALDIALKIIEHEGIENVWKRHRQLAESCRKGLAALGLRCFTERGAESPTVSAFVVPAPWTATAIRQQLEREHNVFVSQGRKEWKEKIIRIGHMGYVTQLDIDDVVSAVAQTMGGRHIRDREPQRVNAAE